MPNSSITKSVTDHAPRPEGSASAKPTVARAAVPSTPRRLGSVKLPDHVAPAAPSGAVRAPWRRPLLVVLGVLVVAVLFFIVMAVGVYGFNWSDGFTRRILRVIPYPIATVNARVIPVTTFRADVDTLQYYYAQQVANPSQLPRPSTNRLRLLALDRLVKTAYLEALATRRGVVVSAADIDAELQKNIDQAGSREEIERSLRQLYNWSIEDFRMKIIQPFLLRERMQESLSADPALSAKAKEKAERVLGLVQAGERSFDDLAQEYSDDPIVDLGYFSDGETTPAFEAAVKALKPGETSALVQSPFGYHIIQLIERIEDEEQGVRYHAKHLLVRTVDLDAWLASELEKAHVLVFDRELRWNREQAQVEERPPAAQNANTAVNAAINAPITPAP